MKKLRLRKVKASVQGTQQVTGKARMGDGPGGYHLGPGCPRVCLGWRAPPNANIGGDLSSHEYLLITGVSITNILP